MAGEVGPLGTALSVHVEQGGHAPPGDHVTPPHANDTHPGMQQKVLPLELLSGHLDGIPMFAGGLHQTVEFDDQPQFRIR